MYECYSMVSVDLLGMQLDGFSPFVICCRADLKWFYEIGFRCEFRGPYTLAGVALGCTWKLLNGDLGINVAVKGFVAVDLTGIKVYNGWMRVLLLLPSFPLLPLIQIINTLHSLYADCINKYTCKILDKPAFIGVLING